MHHMARRMTLCHKNFAVAFFSFPLQQVFAGVTNNINIGGNQLIHLNLQPALSAQTLHTTAETAPVVTQQVRKIAPATDVSRLPNLAPAESTDASTSGASSYILPKRTRRSSDPNKKVGKLKWVISLWTVIVQRSLMHVSTHVVIPILTCNFCRIQGDW